jgi:hypothetical protein
MTTKAIAARGKNAIAHDLQPIESKGFTHANRYELPH